MMCNYICEWKTIWNLWLYLSIHYKITLFGEAKSGSNISSFEGATWPTYHWPNWFMFGNYPWIALNSCKSRIFEKNWNLLKNWQLCEISIKKLYKQKCTITQKLARILKFIAASPTEFKIFFKNCIRST